jgi:peptidoglycan/LPS O-acetylase OafA/YrhL
MAGKLIGSVLIVVECALSGGGKISFAIWSAGFALILQASIAQRWHVRPLAWLGRFSYSLYLIHVPFFVLIRLAVRKGPSVRQSWQRRLAIAIAEAAWTAKFLGLAISLKMEADDELECSFATQNSYNELLRFPFH